MVIKCYLMTDFYSSNRITDEQFITPQPHYYQNVNLIFFLCFGKQGVILAVFVIVLQTMNNGDPMKAFCPTKLNYLSLKYIPEIQEAQMRKRRFPLVHWSVQDSSTRPNFKALTVGFYLHSIVTSLLF